MRRGKIFKKPHVVGNYNFFGSGVITFVSFGFRIIAQVNMGSGTVI